MSMWAAPGVKCICIDDALYPNTEHPELATWAPRKGEIYTVERVHVRPSDGAIGLILVEQLDPNRFYVFERFRPLVTHTIQSDLAIFTPLLDTVEEDA